MDEPVGDEIDCQGRGKRVHSPQCKSPGTALPRACQTNRRRAVYNESMIMCMTEYFAIRTSTVGNPGQVIFSCREISHELRMGSMKYCNLKVVGVYILEPQRQERGTRRRTASRAVNIKCSCRGHIEKQVEDEL